MHTWCCSTVVSVALVHALTHAWHNRTLLSLTHLRIVVRVHDAREDATPKVLDHVLNRSLLGRPRGHDAVLSGGNALSHWTPSVQHELW